jgi:hypothetical protein
MIIGNITLSSKPNQEDLGCGICSFCLEEAEEVAFDHSFDDPFGTVEQWGAGSSCCEEDIIEGKIFLDRTSVHVANKDHFDKQDKLIVQKGDKYRSRIVKGYYIEDGVHKPIFKIEKSKI